MDTYMEFKGYHCVFCGVPTYEQPDSWKNEVRGIYDGPDGVVLSCVANCMRVGRFRARVDPSHRWDGHASLSQVPFDVNAELEFDGQRYFIFHDACWRLLDAALSDSAVSAPPWRIFEVIKSLPFSERYSWGYGWGHRLGGPAVAKEDFLPWEDDVEDIRIFEPVTYADPYNNHETDQILAEIPQSPPGIPLAVLNLQTTGTGLLNTLPYELCLTIAMCLPMRDFFNARLASRAFSPLFYDQLFWASRFKAPSDRAWFFEARKHQQAIDWRSLYRRTNVDRRPTLHNRQRIWNLLSSLMDVLNSRRYDTNMSVSPLKPNPSHSLEVVGDLLGKAGRFGRIKTWGNLESGCRLWHKFHVTVPDNLSQFSVAYIQAPDTGYISGIKFTTTAADVIQLGYWSMTEYSIHVTSITGFVLAVSCRGIRAIQCLTGSETTSRWLGCPDNCPITRRLAVFDSQLDSLEVGLDGFKIVYLATTKLPQQISPKNTIRSLGLWYPDIPDSTLSLNESSFSRCSASTNGFQPLLWANFGGPSGKFLQHLTKISVKVGQEWNRMICISFEYNTEVPTEYRSLGFGRPPDRPSPQFLDRCDRWESFDIDGPGGEIINGIKLLLGYDGSEDMILGVRPEDRDLISTNFARSRIIPSRYTHFDSMAAVVVNVEPGTTITGFYAIQSTEVVDSLHSNTTSLGLTALGVVSETIG
ncbi:hypothetical protein GGR58DRAFT_522393 [Xylaria digitata]|nr:hypothetical protein GGR58DRAFT_522393 [Xylaria digitata]